MIRLYNEFLAENQMGQLISDSVAQYVRMLIEENPALDLNDLESVINHTVSAELAVSRLRYATKLRKQRK